MAGRLTSEEQLLPSIAKPQASATASISGLSEIPRPGFWHRTSNALRMWGVETHGVSPVPLERRTDRRLYDLFWMWFSASMSMSGFSLGTIGPFVFGFRLRDSILVYLFTNFFVAFFPALMLLFGPRLGMRALIQCRYSFGYYGSVIPCALNVVSQMSNSLVVCIISGQLFSAISPHLDTTLGVVLASLCMFVLSFGGYRFLQKFTSYIWIPNTLVFVLMLALGGQRLTDSAPGVAPDAKTTLTFMSVVAGAALGYCPMVADYGVYHDAHAPAWKIVGLAWAGFFISAFISSAIGAAFASSALVVPEWLEGSADGTDLGGLILAVLSPSGGFAKFVVVMAALMNVTPGAICLYTLVNSFMGIWQVLERVPRYVYTVVALAILVPLGIMAAKHFYSTLTSILSIVGYWSFDFTAVVLCEHCVFRRGKFSNYDVEAWNRPRKLPRGFAANLSLAVGIGLVVLSMSQSYFIGPIAKSTGDIALWISFAATWVVYMPLRALEKMLTTRNLDILRRHAVA